MTTDVTPDPPGVDWPAQAVDQLDWHWRTQLRPRLDGLTDAEYLWEPTPGAWNVRPRGTGTAPVQAGSGAMTVDFALPPPEPAPMTTIAWRVAHLVVGVFGARVASHFGGPACDYATFAYPATATEALRLLDEGYAAWRAGVRGWQEDGSLGLPCGPAERPWGGQPRGALVLHINREVIHHGAEISLLRDLYVHRIAH
ncbi:MAG: DinB family protein [Lapillicoccus sp.]